MVTSPTATVETRDEETPHPHSDPEKTHAHDLHGSAEKGDGLVPRSSCRYRANHTQTDLSEPSPPCSFLIRKYPGSESGRSWSGFPLVIPRAASGAAGTCRQPVGACTGTLCRMARGGMQPAPMPCTPSHLTCRREGMAHLSCGRRGPSQGSVTSRYTRPHVVDRHHMGR
jgi:hypothetical protein